jgi:DNA-binding transcriptional ArsR family regulator
MTNQSLALDRVFSALADPTRRGMVARLVQGPASVSELARPFSIALPTVVQHLKVLEESGLVSSAKTGRVRTCRLEQERLDAAQAWLAEQKMIWNARFDRLEATLKEMGDE